MKYLIAGLGNIGSEYDETRHNIGFKILDELASSSGIFFETDRYASRSMIRHKGRTFILIKPSTFMNLSGKAVRYWLDKEKIPVERLLVVTDDLNLDFGRLRMRAKGSDGGHNGLKHIQQVLGTPNYPRLRFGIGDTFHKGQQVDFVLGKWSDEERVDLDEKVKLAAEAVLSFGTDGLARAMNTFNTK